MPHGSKAIVDAMPCGEQAHQMFGCKGTCVCVKRKFALLTMHPKDALTLTLARTEISPWHVDTSFPSFCRSVILDKAHMYGSFNHEDTFMLKSNKWNYFTVHGFRQSRRKVV
jgi:hypothetical protein